MSTLRVNAIQDTSGNDQFASLESTNGYQKLPGGLIIQWGSSTVSSTSSSTVSLPITFSTAFLQVVASSDGSTATNSRVGAAITSTSQVQLINSAGSSQNIRWIAIGY